MPKYRRVVVEADGGSRGNPGPAAYGALVRDADTGEVIAERAETIGLATNNVAEYRGLIAGLELVAEHAPDAEVEVRMDSKLVIEQMAGRWKIKHPDMKPLATEAHGLAPFGVEWTWVPREQNKAADAILNDALDDAAGKPRRNPSQAAREAPRPAGESVYSASESPRVGWTDPGTDRPTTVILLRHGVTKNTVAKRFCGSGGSDPALTDEGVAQSKRLAAYVSRHGGADALVASPLRRTRETAEVVGHELGLGVGVEPGLAETDFGKWEGHSFAEVQQAWPRELDAWLASTAVAPPGGESFESVLERARAARDRLLGRHQGQTVVAVTHVTPIKLLVCFALEVPAPVIYRMELAPASVSTIQWWPGGTSSLRSFSIVPE